MPADIFTGSFDSLRIEGINLDDAITAKTMDYKLIKLVKPILSIHHRKDLMKIDAEQSGDFAQRFLKEMEKLAITKLEIEDATFSLYNDTKKEAPTVLKHVSVLLNDVRLDSATRNDKERFMFAKEAAISFRDYSRPTPDGLYNMKMEKVAINAPANNIVISGFSFTSPYDKKAFAARQKQSKELYAVRFPSVVLKNVAWWTLLNEEEVVTDALTVDGGKLDIFLDRSLPPKDKTGNFPNQMLMKMPVKMNIAKTSIRNLQFSYGEYNPVSKQSGTVHIDDVNIAIANLCNEKRKAPKPVTVNGTALLMRKVPVAAQFSFDMANYKSGRFTARLQLHECEGSLLNSFTEPMGLMKIEKGTLHNAEATISGDERKASGEVFIPYSDLKLSLLEKDKGKAVLDKKDVTSFLANWFVIKNNNPPTGKGSRREQTEFTRIAEGGFFMLVWKTFLVGALRTIGAPEKIAYKTVSSVLKKQ